LAVATSTVRVLSQVTVFEYLFQKNNHLASHHAAAEVKTVAGLSPLITEWTPDLTRTTVATAFKGDPHVTRKQSCHRHWRQ
jgi:hypothetical protein